MKYFSYGMNTNLNSMAMRCPGAKSLGAAVLPHYAFEFKSFATVVPDMNNEVHGVLWEISDADLESLDRLEGFPYYYLRQRAWVETEDGWCVAWVYMMNDQSFESIPSNGYYELCYQGYRENGVDTTQLTESKDRAMNIKYQDYEPFDSWYKEMF